MSISEVTISDHAAVQFLKRFPVPLAEEIGEKRKMILAKWLLQLLFENSKRVRANEKGELYRNYYTRADMIVRNNTVVTIFPLKKSVKSRRNVYAGN